MRAHAAIPLFICISITQAWAGTPTTMGQTGLINMPDAQVAEDGTWRLGVSQFRPYQTIWTSLTVLPALEFSGRYTAISGMPAATNERWKGYGDYKDKAFDVKLRLLSESSWTPAVAIGAHDFLGTRLFSAEYIAATKNIGSMELSAGYGTDRLAGAFGGVRYRPKWAPNWSLVAEHDAINYTNDFKAQRSGAANRPGGLTYGLEYRWGWLGAQLSRQGAATGANIYVSIPLSQKEFVPKIHEPAPEIEPAPRYRLQQWHSDPDVSRSLAQALERQGFKDVRLHLDGATLATSLAHDRITLIGRAAGRAVRTILLHLPQEAREIKLVFTERDMPLLEYHFIDLETLRNYFLGHVSREIVSPSIRVTYATPGYAQRFRDNGDSMHGLLMHEQTDGTISLISDDEYIVAIQKNDNRSNTWRIAPINMSFYFNDPSGALRYDTYATANYTQRLTHGLFLNGSARLTLTEDISGVTQPSNSRLPHVRSDIADYKRGGEFKINNLLLNQYLHLQPRTYARLSVGLYEEMFGGIGGQILYFPDNNRWAADLTVDWLRQRDTRGIFGFRDYSIVSSLAAFHYRLPYNITTTIRAGKFLAGDVGARLEMKRRMRSGIELGAWYTVTDGNDITSPGKPGSPYYDKGLFMRIPLASMLTSDTLSAPTLSLAPWTRDVGQMVRSPGDLYGLMEQRLLLNASEYDFLSELGR